MDHQVWTETRVLTVLQDPLDAMVILADRAHPVQKVPMVPLVFQEKMVQMAMKDLLVKMDDQVKLGQKVRQVHPDEAELAKLVLQEVQVVSEQMVIQVVMVTEVKTVKTVTTEVAVPMVNLVHVEKTVNQDALVSPVDQETTVKPKKARMDLLDHPVLQECPVWMATMVKTVLMVNMVNVAHQVDVENQAKMAAEVMTVNLANLVDLV